MKYKISFFLVLVLFGCNRQAQNTNVLQARIVSLENQIANSYRPGFGEFMSNIQVHHNKLWFAGQNQNWKLADFEIHEIKESLENIQKYQADRKESKELPMIFPSLDSVNVAIVQQNPDRFTASYIHLTNTCNTCHRATGFQFNVVKIPDDPPFSNQDFKPNQ